MEHGAWIVGHIGEQNYRNLKLAAEQITRLSKQDRADIRKELKAQLEDMRKQRLAGNGGRIHFDGWMPDYRSAA